MPFLLISVGTVLHGHSFCAAVRAPFGRYAVCMSKHCPNLGLFVTGSLDVGKESPENFITCWKCKVLTEAGQKSFHTGAVGVTECL